MAILDLVGGGRLTAIFGSLIVLTSIFLYLFRKPAFPKNAPPPATETWPILGALAFFTRRWDFYHRARSLSKTGNFSFYAGQWPVVAVSGDEGRKIFFEHKGLGFSEAYAALLGGSPSVPENNNPFAVDHAAETGFGAYFNKRLISMLKGNRLAQGLPQLLKDARLILDDLAANPDKMTDPYDSIYKMVFRFTMRTVACNEIADNTPLLYKTLSLYETLEDTATPIAIMFPWAPTWAKIKRLYTGARLYTIFKGVVDDRKKHNRREDDALQYLLDQGDGITDILTFVLGALFAGQLNSGVNGAWTLVYLVNKPYWMDLVWEEINTVADRYAPDKEAPLKDRLMEVPVEAWEGEFPTVDICLKESIRLQLNGTAFRKNISGSDIPLNKAGSEVIPKDSYVTYAGGDVHYSPEIYPNPDDWDPGRYLPERAEDKKRIHAFMGWGVARHPCLGMRFAKLEMSMIVAFFFAYFKNIQLVDAQGNPPERLPAVDRNRPTAHIPVERVYLKYELRTD